MLALALVFALAWLAFRALRRGGVALWLGLLAGATIFGGDVRAPVPALAAAVVVYCAVRAMRHKHGRARGRGAHVVR